MVRSVSAVKTGGEGDKPSLYSCPLTYTSHRRRRPDDGGGLRLRNVGVYKSFDAAVCRRKLYRFCLLLGRTIFAVSSWNRLLPIFLECPSFS